MDTYASTISSITVIDFAITIIFVLFHKSIGPSSSEVDSLWGVAVWYLYHQKWRVSIPDHNF